MSIFKYIPHNLLGDNTENVIVQGSEQRCLLLYHSVHTPYITVTRREGSVCPDELDMCD